MKKLSTMVCNFRDKTKETALMYMGGLLVAMFVFLIVFMVFPQLFKAFTIIVELALFGAITIAYSIFVPAMEPDDGRRGRCRLVLRVGFVVFLMYLVGVPLRTLQYRASSNALGSVFVMLTAMTLLLSIGFLVSDSGKKVVAALETGLKESMSGEKTVNPGDIVICDIKEEVIAQTKDPREIIPLTDRFLHMLTIGPTGCGKTSQIILPMVHQDIQNFNCGITVLEPKGDLAIKVAMMAEHYGRPFIYFDPSYKNCPKFNPLAGREVDVVGNIATTFKMLNPDSPQFFLDLNEQLVSNAVKVLKRLDRDVGIEGKWATFINLGRLLQNSGGQGRDMVNNFARISAPTDSEAKENADIATWFLNDYFPERSKVYENTSGVRSQVAKLVSNEYLREALNPDVDKGEKNEVNFDKHLMEGGIICISTAQGALRDLSKYLGYFIILSLQSSVFRRPGTEATRRAHFLYIDEFQTYSTPGFADMLTQGRAYRVGSILATQARAQMAMGGGRDGKNFVELVSSNARNVVLFPGVNKDDAKYYSEQFGEFEKVEVMVGTSRKKFSLLTGGLESLGHPTEMVREQKKMTANFTTTDLIFGQEVGHSFTEIVYSIIKNNSVQPAKVGKISYIPKELNKLLDTRIAEYSALYARESAAEYYARENQAAAAPESPEDTLTFFDGPDAAIGNEVEDLAGGEDDSAFAPITAPAVVPDEIDDLLGDAQRYSSAPGMRDDDVIDWGESSQTEEPDELMVNKEEDIFNGVFDDD